MTEIARHENPALSSHRHRAHLDEYGPLRRATAWHVHGVGTLQLVLEENSLSVELRLPAINVVGFEHAPNDAQRKAAVQNAVALRSHLF